MSARGFLVDRCDRCSALLVRMNPGQHAAVEEVYEALAQQLDWPIGSGMKWSAWDWHQMIMGGFVKAMGWGDVKFAPCLSGQGLIALNRQKQSRLTKRQGSELIEYAKAWAIEHDVILPVHEEEMAA